MRRLRLAPCLVLLSACAGDDAADDAADTAADTMVAPDSSGAPETGVDTGPGTNADTSAGTSAGDDAPTTGADPDLAMAADEFLARWPGLWSGPVDSMTSAGDFPLMNMDVQPADEHTLFSRVDLDANNALRLAFVIEDHDGPALVLRNGGLFLGIQRDDRTALVDADLDAEVWRFCSIAQGCDYIEATMDFDGPDSVLMHVDVRGRFHFDWPATRVEMREIDGPFPADDTPQPGDAPFPTMPELAVTLTWTDPVEIATDAWVILSTTPCFPAADCEASRFMKTTVEVGATSAELLIPQIHDGEYKANAVLDRNGNFAGTLFPDTGDIASFPDRTVTVEAEGTSEASLSLTVEL